MKQKLLSTHERTLKSMADVELWKVIVGINPFSISINNIKSITFNSPPNPSREKLEKNGEVWN